MTTAQQLTNNPKISMLFVPTDKRIRLCKSLFTVSLVLLVCSFLLQICVANTLVIKGSRLSDIQAEKAELNAAIARYKYDDALLSSISTVESRARNMGFVDNLKGVALITTSSVVAVRY